MREVLRNTAVFGNISGPYAKICVGKRTTDVSSHHLYVVHVNPLYSCEHLPRQTTHSVRLLDCSG